ncbi:response regulator [Shimia sp.]|uniref:response regulator n=1 Tax=Shimia sp. TaxID=1954381 RepID=UPI003B8D8679
MFAFALQSLTTLLLAGALVYLLFISERLRNRRRTQQTLLGIIFGIMVISLGMNSLVLEHIRAPFDAKSGPLIFAGYLGGPIGGLIAGLSGALYRVSLGGPSPVLGIFMNLAIPAIGVALSYLRPLRNWPEISRSDVGILSVAFVLLHAVPLWYLSNFSAAPNPVSNALIVVAGFNVLGLLSILLTWQILKYAHRFASDANRAAELATKLDLAMHASGMGMFDHKMGEPGPVFDEGMMSIYGLDREPGVVPLQEWTAMIHADDLQNLKEEMGKIWDGVSALNRADFRLYRTDGSLRYVRANWITEVDIDGTVTRITGMYTDLTDIRETELQHKASQGRVAVIAESLPGVILESESSNSSKPKLLYVSPKCKSVWGVPDTDFYADPSLFFKMHDREDYDTFKSLLRKCIETGEPFFHRYKIFPRNGPARWVDYHGSSSRQDGRVRVQAIVLDATREVEAQEQAEKEREISRRAQRVESIGQLTGGVAHDFNNLLAVILGNLEMLRDNDKPSAQKEMIDTAITATLRGADLTKNMLSFARKAPLMPVVVDLNDVVREAKNWMGRTLPESVVVETSLLAGLWPVEVDRSSLESALLNLTLNARDAMEGHGNLTIETANVRIDEAYIDAREEDLKPGRYVMLAVSDTGSGIAEDVLSSIFEPFFTTKPPGVGSGLGLSMTVGFMRQSEGTVQVYSEVGVGTTFKLYFPAAKASEQPPAKAQIAKEGDVGTGSKLLLAEDDDAVRDTLVSVLKRAGYHVTAANSGDAALVVFEEDPTFDMLLTDIVMPGKLQGTGLAKALRERWPDLPVLFMSGYASEATVHGNGLRAEDIRLMKPVQRAELLAAVAKVISKLKN